MRAREADANRLRYLPRTCRKGKIDVMGVLHLGMEKVHAGSFRPLILWGNCVTAIVA